MSGRACLLLICAALALSACGSGMSDLDRYIAEVKARKSKDIEPIPQIKPYQPFEYTMTDRRDPFVLVEPRNEQANTNGPRPDLRRNREALEAYPPDALRTVGTHTTPARTVVPVRAPDCVVPRGPGHTPRS